MTPKDSQLLKNICTKLTTRFEEISPYKSLNIKERISKAEIVEQLKDILDNGGIEVPHVHLGNIIKAAYIKFNKKPKSSIYQIAMSLYNNAPVSQADRKKQLQQEYFNMLKKPEV